MYRGPGAGLQSSSMDLSMQIRPFDQIPLSLRAVAFACHSDMSCSASRWLALPENPSKVSGDTAQQGGPP